jgi:aryl-alcohol dehydrogenase-like predicted oxidoreductase
MVSPRAFLVGPTATARSSKSECCPANNEVTRSNADAVIKALVKNGGRLIDTASTYGDVESVLGEVTAAGGLRAKLFIATKLETPDAKEQKLDSCIPSDSCSTRANRGS